MAHSVRVTAVPRGRARQAGAWRYPAYCGLIDIRYHHDRRGRIDRNPRRIRLEGRFEGPHRLDTQTPWSALAGKLELFAGSGSPCDAAPRSGLRERSLARALDGRPRHGRGLEMPRSSSVNPCFGDCDVGARRLDHDDLGSIRSKIIVIDSKGLARDAGGKPVSTFPHPALGVKRDHGGLHARFRAGLDPAGSNDGGGEHPWHGQDPWHGWDRSSRPV